jgi:phosphotransferase system HPr (HPr) family protein
MKNNIAWATPLVSALLLAEKDLDRHWHPRHETIEKEVTIMNRFGLHVRPAAMFVRLANRFDSTTSAAKEGVEVDGKSVMSLIADGHGINNCWFQLK